MSIARVLIVEDSPSLARTYETFLKKDVSDITITETGAAARDYISSSGAPDAMLLDLSLPDANGLELLQEWRGAGIGCPIVVITANGSLTIAVSAMREGATDFLVKPFGAERLLTTLENAVEKTRLERVVTTYEKVAQRVEFSGFVGKSLPMQALYRMIEAAAPSDASVLISGETGTGKELTAQAVHRNSRRRKKALVSLNCGAIPKDLIESELFGHVKGAFTGATGDRSGAAERADGGTLFLDELGEMPIELQPKLLRFLQTGEYTRVGDSKTRHANIRFVAATNRDPLGAVRAGLLREDLYFRLNVIPIELPALHERGEDILTLAESFLERFSKEEGKSTPVMSDGMRASLLAHAWPGNVRELENYVRRCVILSAPDGGVLDAPIEAATPVPAATRANTAAAPAENFAAAREPAGSPSVDIDAPKPGLEPLWLTEKKAIETAIALCDGNISLAAKQLGVAPSTIYRKRDSWAEKVSA
ncbi:MAG: sigma-54 dependent transcriptional regulator [Pseudomonadota bacterium]